MLSKIKPNLCPLQLLHAVPVVTYLAGRPIHIPVQSGYGWYACFLRCLAPDPLLPPPSLSRVPRRLCAVVNRLVAPVVTVPVSSVVCRTFGVVIVFVRVCLSAIWWWCCGGTLSTGRGQTSQILQTGRHLFCGAGGFPEFRKTSEHPKPAPGGTLERK